MHGQTCPRDSARGLSAHTALGARRAVRFSGCAALAGETATYAAPLEEQGQDELLEGRPD